MEDASCSVRLLKGIGILSKLVSGYKETHMKAVVFQALMGMVTNLPVFRKKVEDLVFLDPPVHILHFRNGVVGYTRRLYQTNFHFAVPVSAENAGALIEDLKRIHCESRAFLLHTCTSTKPLPAEAVQETANALSTISSFSAGV